MTVSKKLILPDSVFFKKKVSFFENKTAGKAFQESPLFWNRDKIAKTKRYVAAFRAGLWCRVTQKLSKFKIQTRFITTSENKDNKKCLEGLRSHKTKSQKDWTFVEFNYITCKLAVRNFLLNSWIFRWIYNIKDYRLSQKITWLSKNQVAGRNRHAWTT